MQQSIFVITRDNERSDKRCTKIIFHDYADMITAATLTSLAYLRRLCYSTPFGLSLYSMLKPTDLSAFLHAAMLSLNEAQIRRYMPLWRQFFPNPDWLVSMAELQFSIMLVGADLLLLSDMIRDPTNRTYADKRMQVELNLCGSQIHQIEQGVPPSPEYTCDFYMKQQNLILSELTGRSIFKESIFNDVAYVYRITTTEYIEFGCRSTDKATTAVFIVDSARFGFINNDLTQDELQHRFDNHNTNIYTMRPPNPASMRGLPRPLNYPMYLKEAAVPCLHVHNMTHMLTHLKKSRVQYWPAMMYTRNQHRESLNAHIHNYSYDDEELSLGERSGEETPYNYAELERRADTRMPTSVD